MKRVMCAFIVLLFVGVLLLNNVSSQPVLSVSVSGDTSVNMCEPHNYIITIQNTSTTETATNVVAQATIPTGFRIDDNGGGTVVGQTITWNIGDLDPLEIWSRTITLYITCTAVSGQILVDVTHDDGSSQGSIYVSVQPGAVTITKTPSVIPAHLGDTVQWTLTVTSTGFGPIQNVVVEDTLGAGLTCISSSPSGNNVGQITTWNSTHIPALALINPGATVTITIDARVDACSNLENDAQVEWSCNGAPCETETTQASVQLILEEPEISYTLPSFQIPYCSAGTQFTIPITNSGTGTAHDFYLYVDFDPLSVVNVTSPVGASYNNVDKRFEVGDILPGPAVNLIFTLTHSNWCQSLPSGTLLFKPEYTDDCGNLFSPPWQLSSYSITGGTSLSVSKTGAPYEIYLGESITYTITASYSGPTSCPPGPGASNITVVDTIPNGFTITDAGGGTVMGNTITWIVVPSVGLNTTITLQSPPYTQCETYCYTYATNTVNATMIDCCGCPLTASASQTTALECEEYFDSEKTVSSTTNFEKCTDLYYTNTYIFDDDVWWDGVNWTDFIFYEEMPNDQIYVGNLFVIVNGTCQIVITPTFDPRLILDFSTGDYSSCDPFPSVRNSTLVITYTLRTTDSSLPACEASYSFYDWSILDTGKTGGVCQPDQEIQETVYVTVNQAQMSIGVAGLPAIVDSCGTYNVDINLNRASVVGAYDVLVVLPTDNYNATITGYTGPVPVTTVFADRIEFDYGDAFVANNSAQIHVTFQNRCSSPSDLSVTVYWDGYCQNDATPDMECSASAGGSPILVEGSLLIKKTPELIYATENQVTWAIYVINSGSGTAYNAWVEDVLGSDLQYNSSSVTDLHGVPVIVTTNVNQDHNGIPINGDTWIMDIPAGATRVITLTADIIGCNDLDNDVSASWGCLGEDCQAPVSDHSTVAIPPSNAVTTNTLPADIDLCGQENITVQVKNAGITTIYNVEVEVTLPPGLHYMSLSGIPADPQDPSANPVVWTSTEVAALASLAPAGQPGDTVSISFDVIAGCDFPSGNRTIVSKASYDTVCGEPKVSPESRSTLPVREPNISIVKDGRNVTAGGSYVETVNAEPGDTVEWRIQISNTGAITALNVEFWDVLPSNMTLSTGPGLPGSGTQADPWVHGSLLVSASVTYYVQATVDANECTDPPTTNTACVWYGCDDDPTTPGYDPCRMPQICDTARLRTTAQFNINQTLGLITTCDGEITVTIYNYGPTAYNVVVTDFIPTGFEYHSMISGPTPIPDPPANLTQPIWVIGNMLEGQTVVLHFRIIDDGINCGVVIPDTNTVHVDFDNVCGQHYTRTNSANVSPLMAVLTVEKTPETVTRPPGGTTTWTITVTNTGNYQAENVEVVDNLSLNFINIVANNGSGGEVPVVVGNTVTWNLANPLPIGGTWIATLSADITGFLGTDTVIVSGYCSTGCVYSTSSDEAYTHTIEGLFKSPDLQTATIGEEVTFDISSSYWGTSNYQNVQIIDTLPAGLEYVTSTYTHTHPTLPEPAPVVVGQIITWTLGDFTGPNTVDITVTARVQDIPANVDGVILTNWARTIGSENGHPFDPIPQDYGDVQIIEPNLTIDKQGSITAGLPGDTIHYTITVPNTLTSPAYDVPIEDVVPAGLILIPASITSTPSADSTTVVGNTITWNYTIIPVGTTLILEYDAVIPTDGGIFTNTSTVTDYSSLLGDSIYERHYPPISDPWTVEAPGTDILKLTLNTTINVPSPGGVVYFELTITNTGSMPLDPVQLIDILPDGLTYLPGTSVVHGVPYEPDSIVDNADGTQTLTWLNIGAMNPTDTIVVTFEATVDPDRVGTFINRAIVIGTSVIGDVTDEDDSPVGVKAPAIHIVKSIIPSVTDWGNKVDVILRVTNTGEVPLDPVVVDDILPVGLTYADEANPVPDSVTVNPDDTTTLVWNNVGPLDIGESVDLEFKAIFNGKERTSINNATATGTPPNGFPVSDEDSASVTVPTINIPPIWKVLAYNGMYRCQICDLDDLFEKAREIGLDFSEELDECCMPDNLVETLQEEIKKRGLETDPRYEKVLELIEYAEYCCDDAFEAYFNGNYIKAYRLALKRCETQRELIELMIAILSPSQNTKGCGCQTP